MRIIKLDATDSTNDFLKRMIDAGDVKNLTVVSTEMQTRGRGQMGAEWLSEKGKNLMVSVLLVDAIPEKKNISDLGIIASLAVFTVLKEIGVPKLKIKWPNDIMSGKRKICGILIENIFKAGNSTASVLGFGVNVNQVFFPSLPDATSVAIEISQCYDKHLLLDSLISALTGINKSYPRKRKKIRRDYHDLIYRKDIPTAFESRDRGIFMGMIRGVSEDGRLLIQLEDDTTANFGIRDLKMLV